MRHMTREEEDAAPLTHSWLEPPSILKCPCTFSHPSSSIDNRFHFSASYSPSLHVYGYEIDQPAAIRYLIARRPEWERRYTYFGCHYKALDLVSKELSQSCELTLHSNPIWIGGGYISFAMVFYGEDIEEANRDPRKLEKLEKLLASTGISYKPTPQLEYLCSAAYRKYPVEPQEMSQRPQPPHWNRRCGGGLMALCGELNSLRRRAQSEQKPLEKGAGRERPQDGKRPPKKKRRTGSGEEPGRQTGDHGGRCVL